MPPFSHFLRTLPAAERRALPNDLRLGYGRLQYAERLHRDGPPAAVTLCTLGAAHAALRSALAILDDHAPNPALDVAPAPLTPTDALPPAWDTLVGDGAREVMGALIEMASEMARDAVAAIRADADVDIVRMLVREALLLLADVRDDALGTT